MKIVVTGGSGFIGSNIARELDKNHEVIVLDDFSNGDFRNLTDFSGIVYACDLTNFDWDAFFKDTKIDVIYHQAAITDTTVLDQKKMMDVNVNTFKKILDYAVKNKTRVIYASSAAVYGRGKSPMQENQELNPLNVYGFSKRIMDNLAQQHIQKYPEIALIGLRYFNVFGPGESHKNKFASMIYQLYLQMKDNKRPRIFTDGQQTRDHIYIKDVVQANIKMMNCNQSGVYNLGTGKETSFNEIITYINDVLKKQLQPDYFENPYDFYQDRTCADIEKISKAINYKPEFSVKKGIEDYFEKFGK